MRRFPPESTARDPRQASGPGDADRRRPDLDISVIIATRNRCDKLAASLARFDSLAVPAGLRWEIIVVDNASSDATAAVCQSFAARHAGMCVYLHEPRKGKSIALNSALRLARGEILAFTDDDCIVHDRWLEEVRAAFADDPELAVLGGKVELNDVRDVPLSLVAIERATPLTSVDMLFPDPPVIGANMALRRAVFDAVGDFDVRLGPGTSAIAEDVDLVYRAFKRGFKVVTLPTVLVFHDHGRREDTDIAALLERYHVGRGAFYFKHVLRGDRAVARMAVLDVWASLRRMGRLRGVRGQLRYLRSLAAGARTRLVAEHRP